MKNLSLTLIIVVFSLSINAQTDSCQVLLEKISGIYTGKCVNGLANGKGKSIGEDTYVGTFKDGLPDGKGKYIYKNGDTFQGSWSNGQKNGKGKFEYTLEGKKYTLKGYWEKDEYVGATDPDIAYRVSSVSGIMNYDVKKNESISELDKMITFSIKSAFSDFAPTDLKIDISSGQIIQSGKKFSIFQYFCPLHCEISYTILVSDTRKQCRFIIDIYKEGSYTITLSND